MAEIFSQEFKRILESEGFQEGLQFLGDHKKKIDSCYETGIQVVHILLDFVRFEEAAHLLDCLQEKHGLFPGGHLARSKLLRLERRFEEAEKECLLEMDNFPITASQVMEIISLYYQWKKPDKCLPYISELEALLPNSLESKVFHTYIFIALKDLKGAKEILKSSENLKCTYFDVNYSFGWLKEYVEHNEKHSDPPLFNGKISEFKDLWPFIDSIFKYLSREEAELLFNMAKDGPGKGTIVEIGSECGRSTVVLGWGSKLRGREKVFSIDIHLNPHLYQQYMDNIKKIDLEDYVIPYIGLSSEAAMSWPNEKIRLLFIDGNHSYPFVLEDFENWTPYLCNGGVVVLHDTGEDYEEEGPRRVLKEKIISSPHYTDVVQMENMAYARKV